MLACVKRKCGSPGMLARAAIHANDRCRRIRQGQSPFDRTRDDGCGSAQKQLQNTDVLFRSRMTIHRFQFATQCLKTFGKIHIRKWFDMIQCARLVHKQRQVIFWLVGYAFLAPLTIMNRNLFAISGVNLHPVHIVTGGSLLSKITFLGQPVEVEISRIPIARPQIGA